MAMLAIEITKDSSFLYRYRQYSVIIIVEVMLY